MDSGQPILALRQVTKRFAATADAEPVEVLRGIDLDLGAAQSLAIIGPSGSGKSTLLNVIGTLDRPSSGVIRLAGRDLAALDDSTLAEVRNRDIGFIFQAHHLLPQCTVLENVLVPTLAGILDPPAEDWEARAARLLERVRLGHRLNHRPAQLSGGERQRVAVVRALINRPKLLLADEPTGALDRASAESLGRLLLELNRDEKVTLIVVTHALDLAGQLERTLELRDGQLHPLHKPS